MVLQGWPILIFFVPVIETRASSKGFISSEISRGFLKDMFRPSSTGFDYPIGDIAELSSKVWLVME